MIRIAIIVGSTRPSRRSPIIANWVFGIASVRTDAHFELVDIADFRLPLLDERQSADTGQYEHEHTRRWADRIASFDGFVFVTTEYNHGPPAALKNAIDYLYHEWWNKSAGFVGYGGSGAARSIEQLRSILSNFGVADVGTTVGLTLRHDFTNFEVFSPGRHHVETLGRMLDEVISWARALKPLRL